MFQRFTSALFGANVDELRPEQTHSQPEEEEEEDWILLNYLTEACSGSAAAVDPDEDEDLVMIPSPMSGPVVRYPSCTSLNSTEPDDLDPSGADPDLDVADDEKDCDGDDDDGEGFLRLDAVSLEESWFVTPPACFTRSQPLPLEPSPLENLLIEHPSMSVYLLPSNGSSKPRPHLQRLTGNGGKPTPTAAKKEKRRSMEARHRSEGIQRRSGLHSSCLSASFSARVDLLQPHSGPVTQRHAQPLSRNALRRLNPQRPPKTAALQLHQPSHRHLNF